MSTGDHYHDRPLVDWCSYWQVMAAKRTERRPRWRAGIGGRMRRLCAAVKATFELPRILYAVAHSAPAWWQVMAARVRQWWQRN